jgi:hypothetical protein
MNIKTNNQYRYYTYFCNLAPKVQAEFDYLDPENEDHQYRRFVKYKGQWYDLNDFLRCNLRCNKILRREGGDIGQWDGYSADSYFSGVLCKYDQYDSERVLMASFYN